MTFNDLLFGYSIATIFSALLVFMVLLMGRRR